MRFVSYLVFEIYNLFRVSYFGLSAYNAKGGA